MVKVRIVWDLPLDRQVASEIGAFFYLVSRIKDRLKIEVNYVDFEGMLLDMNLDMSEITHIRDYKPDYVNRVKIFACEKFGGEEEEIW